jgi:hypothetical protein
MLPVVWRMRLAGQIEHAREKGVAYRVLIGRPEERDHAEDVHVSGRLILKWMLKK